MNYRIPLFDLNFGSEEEEAALACLRSKWISSGPATEQFESKFANMCGIPHAVAVSNCTAALHIAMLLADVGPEDEVICPSLTFVATANAIRYVRATPVFADIVGEHDLTIDPDDIEAKITPKTKAIIVMHHSGFPCDMDRIMSIAEQNQLLVIEDACHGPFSEYKDGRKLGSIGHIGCFSFFSNKNISTGEGGMLVTRDNSYAQRARLLRSHGMTSMSYNRSQGHTTSYDVIEHGYNYRLDDIRSSIGMAQLEKIAADYECRAKIRQYYESALSDISSISIPFKNLKGYFSNYIFPILVSNDACITRDSIRVKLAESGIQTSIHYPPIHLFSTYKNFHTTLPKTEKVASSTITLPMHGTLQIQGAQEVFHHLKKFL